MMLCSLLRMGPKFGRVFPAGWLHSGASAADISMHLYTEVAELADSGL